MRRLVEQAKSDFDEARYSAAEEGFGRAAAGFAAGGDLVNQAEQKNNLAVALLKLRRPQEALEEVLGTDEVFRQAGDARRQGMACNNQAAALQDLGRLDEALISYERSAELLGQAGEGDLRSMALKAAAALQLRRGRISDSGFKMLGALGSGVRLTWLERVLKSILRRPK